MNTPTRTLSLLLLLAGLGCGDAKPPADSRAAGQTPAKTEARAPAAANARASARPDPAPPLDPRVARAAEIARAIDQDPARADQVLASKGLDRDALEALMYEIAQDPALSAAYEQARAQ